MSIYNRDKTEWVGFKSGCLEVIEKVGEEDYQNKGSNGKVYVYKRDLLKVVCKCGREKTMRATSLVGNKPDSCRFCATKKKNGVGEKCGTLVCIDVEHTRYDNGRSKIVFLCQCEVCKTEHSVKSDIFRLGETSCPSCRKNSKMHFVTKFSKPTNIDRYYSTIKTRSNKNNLEFDITKESIIGLLIDQDYKCKLSNQTIGFDDGSASLDRIDSEKGYTQENIQWLHRNINYMKNTMPEGMFITWCSFVTEHSS